MLVALSANPTSAELHTGHGTLAWDFSSGAQGPESDIGLLITFAGPYFIQAQESASVLALGDRYEDLTEAPTDPQLYRREIPYEPGFLPTMSEHVIVVRTREGHYAKFKFTFAGRPPAAGGFNAIDYTYQDDGSNRFYNSPGAENAVSTWGRIKAMYDL